jgi:hypothetical protein
MAMVSHQQHIERFFTGRTFMGLFRMMSRRQQSLTTTYLQVRYSAK